MFIQRKDYANALRQVKSLDRRLKENGFRVFQFAETVANDKYYDVAIDAYAYIITEKGPGTPIYVESKRQLLRCKREKLVQDYVYTRKNSSNWNRNTSSFSMSLAATAIRPRSSWSFPSSTPIT